MNKKDISKYYTDENVVRLIAAQVMVIVFVSLWQGWLFPLFLICVDFALRAFTYQPAPLAAVAKLVSELLKLKSKPIFAAPKKFAAGVGFVFSVVIFLLFYFKLLTAAHIVGGILIFLAFWESVFKICVGCYVYNWLVAPIINKRNKLRINDRN